MNAVRVAIDSVRVGDRHRRDLGDLTSLSGSIKKVGLLHPIVLTTEKRLIAGQRRLEACRLLGWREVPCTFVSDLSDASALLIAERDENTCRLEMTPSEKVSIGRKLEGLVAGDARKRQEDAIRERDERGRAVATSEKFTGVGRRGDTRDLVGKAIGMSGVTYTRAKDVVSAAERGVEGAPEAMEEMDRTGKVAKAFDSIAPAIGKSPSYVRRAARGNETFTPASQRDHTRAEAHKRKMEVGLSGIIGFVRGLEDVDLSMALAKCDGEERDRWARATSEVARKLLRLARTLKTETESDEAA